jgi:hypothetical protein
MKEINNSEMDNSNDDIRARICAILDPSEDAPLCADGFDEAILGVARRAGKLLGVVYDKDRCIDLLCKDMNYEEALEYFDYNIAGAWVGPLTPLFLEKIDNVLPLLDLDIDDVVPAHVHEYVLGVVSQFGNILGLLQDKDRYIDLLCVNKSYEEALNILDQVAVKNDDASSFLLLERIRTD